MKRCFKCGETKTLSEFYPHKAMGDGHLGKCKSCTKQDVHAHRQANLMEYRQYDRNRARQPHRIAQAKRVQAEWRIANPERRRAEVLLGNAVRAGRVQRWPVCAIPDCPSAPEAHHPNYDAPLDVVWLCPAHHKQTHAIAASYTAAERAGQ